MLAHELGDSIRDMYVEAIRKGVEDGLRTAVRDTVHDSSNAGVHWMVGVEGVTRTGGRKLGKAQDLRGGANPPVGKRDDNGIHEDATVEFVANRELAEVIHKHARGNNPEVAFFFYNAVADVNGYRENAFITEAGHAAIQRTIESFQREIAKGRLRKRRLK